MKRIFFMSCGVLLTLSLFSCKKDKNDDGTNSDVTYSIGQEHGGGIIFYLDDTKKHGLISATSDQSTSATWGCKGTDINADGANVGTGKANTQAIVNNCSTSGIAARICYDLTLNGYSDWYLPSTSEISEMQKIYSTLGLSTASSYWSSTESSSDANRAISVIFGPSYYGGAGLKDGTSRVRAIRSF